MVICCHSLIGVRFLTERDIPSLGVRTGGWVEVDVSVAAAAVAAVALGFGQVLRTFSKELCLYSQPSGLKIIPIILTRRYASNGRPKKTGFT